MKCFNSKHQLSHMKWAVNLWRSLLDNWRGGIFINSMIFNVSQYDYLNISPRPVVTDLAAPLMSIFSESMISSQNGVCNRLVILDVKINIIHYVYDIHFVWPATCK